MDIIAFAFLAVIGSFVVFRFALTFLTSLWIVLLRPSKSFRRYGSWAVVTGSTDGIGKSFATQLAKKKLNLVLVSRTEEKLKSVASELESKYKIQTKILAVDFTSSQLEADLLPLAKLAKELDIGILINNAGFAYPHAKFFHEVDSELITNLIRVNVEALTRVTRILIPGMVERKKGAIVNIGSGAATVLPSDPLYSVYAATKAYVDQFSRSLYVEYKDRGIDVQCQAPLYVATKLAKIRHASFTCPSADVYAKYGLNFIGYEPRCTPYWVHAVMWWLVAAVPPHLMDKIRFGQTLGLRKRALAKEARKKEQ